MRIYQTFANQKLIRLCDLQEQRIYAYPYAAFRDERKARSQGILHDQYTRAQWQHQMVVLVRDNARKKLVASSLDYQ